MPTSVHSTPVITTSAPAVLAFSTAFTITDPTHDVPSTAPGEVRVIESAGNDYQLTGFTAGADGQRMLVYNAGASRISLVDDDAGSAAANRLSMSGDKQVQPGTMVEFVYSATAQRWILVHVS